MRATSKRKTADAKYEGRASLPEVIVDFDCRQDLLYMVIANVGSSSAHKVSIEFDKEITDFRGRRLSQLDVFHHLEFLAPGKQITFFVDDLSRYIKRKQPLRIGFSIAYFDRNGQRQREFIRHDLTVFKDLVVADEPSPV